MISEVIWTSAASQDYLEVTAVPPPESIDAMIELLKLFPDMGSVVSLSHRVRRALLGRHRQFGLYYAAAENRLIVVALLDLRQDPAAIERILVERGIGT